MNTTATSFCGDPIFNVIVTFGSYGVSLGGIVGVLAVVLFAMISGAVSIAIYQCIGALVDSWHRRLSQSADACYNERNKHQEIPAAVCYVPPGYYQCA